MEGCKKTASLIFALFLASCIEHKTPTANYKGVPPQPQTNSTLKQPDFAGVKEMLSRNCTPCHEPGGKMYERLPFDNPDVVRSHSEPILKRIDKPEDKKLMEDWLSEPQH
jgi:hypothetical protein